MGFFDKVKKVLESRKEDVESQNSVNDEVIDEPTSTESIGKDNENFNDDEEIQSNDLEETPANEEIIDKPTPNDKIKNFKYLDDLIHNGVKQIVLDSNIVLSDGEESEYKEGIKIDVDDLIVDGNGQYIDGDGKARIFFCTGKNITIKNIILKNGFSEHGGFLFNNNTADGGGAIYNEKGELTIIESIFERNNAERYGGAIYNENGELTITESTLTENTAEWGGAIYNKGDVMILDSSFSVNKADSGGAIYAGEGALLIKGSAFSQNMSQSSFGGGAILNYECTLVIEKSEFINNKTSEKYFLEGRNGGGAIKNYGELTISESSFHDNIAEGKNLCGGAIYNGGQLKITQSTFAGNTANDNGGAILNDGAYSSSISKSVFASNISNSNGGALFNTLDELTVSDSQFNDNMAGNTGNGGAVYNGGSLILLNSVFDCNDAGRCGGAIFNTGHDLSVTESSFKKNTAQNGAAISNKGNFKISECEITDNNSSNIVFNLNYLEISNSIFMANHGENIICNNGDIANLGIFYVKFRDNVAGSVIFNTGKFCVIERGAFENIDSSKNIVNHTELTLNNAKITSEGHTILNDGYILIKKGYDDILDKIGGEGNVENLENRISHSGISDFGYLDEKIHENGGKEIVLSGDISIENYEMDYYEGGIELDIDGLVIDGAGHTIDGGGKSRIFIITGDNITLKNITFKNGFTHRKYENPINNRGSAIKVNNCINLTIENCKFINNSSEEGSGAIFNTSAKLNILESTFSMNASYDGGAIYNYKGVLSVVESAFKENCAKSDGGAIISMGSMSLRGCNLSGNSAEDNGGAISNKGSVTVIECDLSDNTANSDGGAVYNSKGTLIILKSSFKDNTAYSGGAICNYGDLIITDSSLSDNNVNNSGGAISSSGTMKVVGCTLSANTSNRYSGAISSHGKSMISASILSDNIASERGGAIGNGGDLTIKDSDLLHNTAKHGGAINGDRESILHIKNSNFRHNEAKMPPGFKWEYGELKNNYGGAIHNSGRLNIEDSAFTGNSSTHAGAIYTSRLENQEIKNCSFNGNEPDDVNDKWAG